jgi:transposase
MGKEVAMGREPIKPTRTETSLEQRRPIVRLSGAGWSAAAIAAELGVSRWTVGRWIRRAPVAGAVGLAYRPRRPMTPHPPTTPPAVRARIRAIREAHPGWGARLIRHQLARAGIAPLPAERTIQRWLARLGFALLRPPTGQPLGWPTPATAPTEEVWEADFVEKGGPPISLWSVVVTGRPAWPPAPHPPG